LRAFSGKVVFLNNFQGFFNIITMEVVKINGIVRDGVGKKASKADRGFETIPCVLYGGNENVHFTTTWSDIRHLVYTPDFKTADLSIAGQTYKAILKDVQFHPASEQIMHIDFLKMIPNHPIKVNVPLRLKGQSPGVKAGGKLIQGVRKVKIKCTPEALIDSLDLDISSLELGQTVRVRDIQPKNGVEIMMAPAVPVAIIEIPRALRSAATAEAKAAGKKK
jgi:large subunit ribosomal protein L25